MAEPAAFAGVTVALFSAGAAASRELAPAAAKHGATVIDNSSAWRMDPEVPLVVPEVNLEGGRKPARGIIANPNCSTIQLMVALKPLHDAARVRHIVVSTYQAASGKGQAALEELQAQTRELAEGKRPTGKVFPGPLAGNVLMDWKAADADWSEEELKMVHETRKILGDPSIGVSPTTVRVPVATGTASGDVQFPPAVLQGCPLVLRKAPSLFGPYGPCTPPASTALHRRGLRGSRARRPRLPGALTCGLCRNPRKGAALNADSSRGLFSSHRCSHGWDALTRDHLSGSSAGGGRRGPSG